MTIRVVAANTVVMRPVATISHMAVIMAHISQVPVVLPDMSRMMLAVMADSLGQALAAVTLVFHLVAAGVAGVEAIAGIMAVITLAIMMIPKAVAIMVGVSRRCGQQGRQGYR